MVKSDASWSPTQADLDWIEATGRPPHSVLVEMEAAAVAHERIPILSRDSGRMLAVLAANRRRVIEIGTAIGCSGSWPAAGDASSRWVPRTGSRRCGSRLASPPAARS